MKDPGEGGARGSPWPYLAHLPVVAWLFAGALFEGQLPYFRDVCVYYYPNYVFLEQSLRQGVWPLWNPLNDAGAPFLIADPADLLLVGILGAERALRFAPPLHLLLAMAGASHLARGLGLRGCGVWASGLFYGLSGYVLSTANLFELFHATAWAPWVVGAALRLWDSPTWRRVAALGFLGAVQVATLGAETVFQTGVVAGALLTRRPDRHRLAALLGAAALALCLAAPAILGVLALVRGTPRAEGLDPRQSFAFSLRPPALVASVFPGFFGDVHTFSDQGFWGQPFFPAGFPYLLSLYWGPGLLWLALRSPATAWKRRLLVLLGLGLLLSLGAHGPLAWLLGPLMAHFRSPPKLFFMANLAVCLLAAFGLDRAAAAGAKPTALALLPGLGLLASVPLLRAWPDLPGRLVGDWLPEILDPRARYVIASAWPAALGLTGILLLAAVMALRLPRLAPVAGLLLGFDLLLVNGSVVRTTGRSFYTLRPEVAALVEGPRREPPHRWFAYGAASIPDLRWSGEVARRNSDVWLYYLERQALTPRTQVLDGLEGAFDEDRVGWAPPDSTLAISERVPSAFRSHHARLRLANVRFVLSFRPLPEDLVSLRGRADLSETLEPLHLYELHDALPRAFRVSRVEVEPDGVRSRGRLEAPEFDARTTVLLAAPPPGLPPLSPEGAATPVHWERLDPHTVRLRVPGPPGLVVVSEGYHPDWQVDAPSPRAILRANGRYWAVPSEGGGEVLTVRYRPRWRTAALVLGALGLAGAIGLARRDSGTTSAAG